MGACSEELRELSGDAREPYREVLRLLRNRLKNTLSNIEQQLAGQRPTAQEFIADIDELWHPLHACFQSLVECGMSSIANRLLLDPRFPQ